MRYGEIALVTPKDLDAEKLVRAVCADVHHASSTLHFGRLPVSDNLTLYVYGMQISSDPENYRWNMLLSRVLGIVVAYQGRERPSLVQAQRLLDFFRAGWQVPILVAADAGNGAPPVPPRFCEGGIRLSAATRFLFFRSHDVASVRAVYATLLDLLLDRVPDP